MTEYVLIDYITTLDGVEVVRGDAAKVVAYLEETVSADVEGYPFSIKMLRAAIAALTAGDVAAANEALQHIELSVKVGGGDA